MDLHNRVCVRVAQLNIKARKQGDLQLDTKATLFW